MESEVFLYLHIILNVNKWAQTITLSAVDCLIQCTEMPCKVQ